MGRGSILDRDHGGNISCLVRPNCRQLFFVYAGGAGMIDGMGPMEFLHKSGLGNRNVVFMRDPHTERFEKGISDELDSLDAVLEWHLDYLEAADHVDEVYCTGNSIGGNAALLFGHLILADKVWAFAPAHLPALPFLLEVLREGNGKTEYEVHYSEKVWFDRFFARQLQGVENLKLIVNNDHGHLMLSGLTKDGKLPGLYPPYRGVDR